jgi:hypothetical protein
MKQSYAKRAGSLTFFALLGAVAMVACSADGSRDDGGKGGVADGTTATKGSGLESCVRACDVFRSTGCSTRAATFCSNARQNCATRYENAKACGSQLEALDACSAALATRDYVCPLGTLNDPLRPYRSSEDVCVPQAQALADCLSP